MALVDTDILIWILRGDRDIRADFERMVIDSKGLMFVSPVQVAEVHAGLRPKEEELVHTLLSSLREAQIDGNTGRLAGQFMNKYGKSHAVTLADALTAASAKVNGLRLWTLNRKHYPMLREDDFVGPPSPPPERTRRIPR